MGRRTWGTLSVVAAAGAVTAWHSYRLHAHHMVGLPVPDASPVLLAVSVAPTALFLAAGLAQRRSVGMLVSLAVAAALVAAMRVYVIRIELSAEWTHGTGLFAAVAWAIGMGVAVGVAIVAAVAVALESARGRRGLVERAGPGAAADGGA